jgi:hypothetical protein
MGLGCDKEMKTVEDYEKIRRAYFVEKLSILAHRGALFLDELPKFGARVLEIMSQPIEDKVVTISRAQG